jgi:tetratricopeptide (TPR) repeat protein
VKSFIFLALFVAVHAMASDAAFTNSLNAAVLAEKRGDVPRAAAIYDAVRSRQTNDPATLCLLARRYCDLACLARSTALQTDLVARALGCAQLAETLKPNDATAHASAAVCYAKSCAFSDIKTQLAYSRLFKQEAEKAIALDPKQDVAWYLLGRWNYGIANVGFFSRAYVRMVYGGLPKASFQSAVAYFQKACKLAPNRIIYHAGLAMAYDALGQKKLELAELKTCCALKPSDLEDADARKQAALELKDKE